MLDIEEMVKNRTKGQMPISIATSLAFEGAFGIMEDGPRFPKPPILSYGTVWLNVRTLIRNINGSLDTATSKVISHKNLFETLVIEMMAIEHMLEEKTNGQVKPIFYYCEYNDINAVYRKAIVHSLRTDLQRFHRDNENNTIGMLENEPLNHKFDLRKFNTRISPQKGDSTTSLMVTHYPIDLLNRFNFKKLDLLESHTGKIKMPTEWSSKLKGGKSLQRIPFDRMTVQMFGDSSGMVYPQAPAHRNAVMKIAETKQWSSATTEEKIRKNILDNHDAELTSLVNEMYR